MDFVRHHLGQAVALSRPELTPTEQQRLLEQVVELIGRAESGTDRLPRMAVGDTRDLAAGFRRGENHHLSESGGVAFAITCAPEGTIKEVIRDGMGLSPRLAPGTMLTALAGPFHHRKASRFLHDVGQKRFLFDCPLSVLGPSGMVRLFWSAISVESRIIVIGTKEPLSASVPVEVVELAERQQEAIQPFLTELARWRSRSDSEARTGRLRAPRGRLLELAAHDLCNPISGIITACEYLIEDAAKILEPHQTLFLYSIASSSRQALNLIRDMAEIPWIRLGKPALELQPMDIVSVVQQEIASLRPLAHAMKVTVDLNITQQMPILRGDPLRLAEAVHGLMVNAIGPASSGGRIEIEMAGGANGISVALRRVLPPAPSSQARSSGSRKRPRKLADVYAALMLAQARRIVSAHGGVLRIDGHGEQGPTWTVKLPATATALVRTGRTIGGVSP